MAVLAPPGNWLSGVRAIAADLATALARRDDLGAGEIWVTPSGDLVGRRSVTLFAPDGAEACGFSSASARSKRLQACIAERQLAVDSARSAGSPVDERLETATRGEVAKPPGAALRERQERGDAVQL